MRNIIVFYPNIQSFIEYKYCILIPNCQLIFRDRDLKTTTTLLCKPQRRVCNSGFDFVMYFYKRIAKHDITSNTKRRRRGITTIVVVARAMLDGDRLGCFHRYDDHEYSRGAVIVMAGNEGGGGNGLRDRSHKNIINNIIVVGAVVVIVWV